MMLHVKKVQLSEYSMIIWLYEQDVIYTEK